jgi:hypothetical protein
MQREKYDIQKEFENAGLFLDEVEFDNIERLQYANSLSKEDWARSYIRRKRPEGLTLEIARDEIVRRKHKADALAEELRIKHRKVNFAAFAGANVITAINCLSSRPIQNAWDALFAYAVMLAGGFLGLFCSLIISGIWEALVARSSNKLLSGRLGTILSYAVVPFVAAVLCFLLNHIGSGN